MFNQPNWKNKKITIMGLGLLGRGLGDAKFLAEEGANLIVTDLKTGRQLRESLVKLKKYKNIKFVFGQHRACDFKNRDMILRGPSVPNDSPFLNIARSQGIPVEMDDSLFAKYCPCPIIGVTGTRGKTTAATLIHFILKNKIKGKVNLAGNIQGVATLPLIRKVKKSDLVVLELSSWQLQGWAKAKISPHVAVIINIYPDHLNYYNGDMKTYIADKKAIYQHQTKNDYLILNRDCQYSGIFAREAASKTVWFRRKDVPRSWKIKLLGEHNLENIAAAMAVAKILRIKNIKQLTENFKGIEHRLELVREIHGVKYINDSTSTTPIATQKALNSFNQPIVLIAGGSDKGLDFKDLTLDIKKKCKAVILLKGNGSDKIKKELSIINYLPAEALSARRSLGEEGAGENQLFEFSTLNQAILKASKLADRGDVILFSPACASFGLFINEYDRGLKFKKIIKSLR